MKNIKRLKEFGVPFVERIKFRISVMPMLVMYILLLLTSPFLLIWTLIHFESAEMFMDGLDDVLEKDKKEVTSKIDALIKKYGAV